MSEVRINELPDEATVIETNDYLVADIAASGDTRKFHPNALLNALNTATSVVKGLMSAAHKAFIDLLQSRFNIDGQLKTAGIEDAAVTGAKLAATVAGGGIAQDGTTKVLYVDTDGTLAIDGETDKLKVNVSALAGDGLGVASSALKVNVDNATIEIHSDVLRLKTAGIGLDKLDSAAAAAISVTDVTYDDLVTLIDRSELVPGAWYRITDYRTKYEQAVTGAVMTAATEPLLVMAITNAILAPIAYSEAHPEDVIYYSVNNDGDRMPGADRGFIYRRIDVKKNNDMPYDFRTVLFRRWKIDTPPAFSGTQNRGYLCTFGGIIYVNLVDGNDLSPDDAPERWGKFPYPTNSYVSPTQTSWLIVDDVFTVEVPCTADYINVLTFQGYDLVGVQVYDNRIDSNSRTLPLVNVNTVFRGTALGNVMGNGMQNNTVGDLFVGNQIGIGFSNNAVGAGCNRNVIGADVTSNVFGENFSSNKMDGGSGNNIYGHDVANTHIGTTFNSNTMGDGANSNSIGHSVQECCMGALIRTTVMDGVTGCVFTNSAFIDATNKQVWYNNAGPYCKVSYLGGDGVLHLEDVTPV